MDPSEHAQDLPNGYLYSIASDEVREALWIDQQFIKILKTLSKNAKSLSLRTECEDHAIQIDTQMERLRGLSRVTGMRLQAKENKAAAVLMNDALDAIQKYQGLEALDTVLTCIAQKISRMRMSIYSNATTYLGLMEFETAEMLLSKTYHEEVLAEDRLQSIAYEKLLPLDELPKRKPGFWENIKDFFNG